MDSKRLSFIDQTLYTITVVTSSESNAGTNSGVLMTIYGGENRTKQFQLIATEQDSKLLFQPGSTDKFQIELNDVGTVCLMEIFQIIYLLFLTRLIKSILNKMEKVFARIGIYKKYRLKKDQKSTSIGRIFQEISSLFHIYYRFNANVVLNSSKPDIDLQLTSSDTKETDLSIYRIMCLRLLQRI